MSQNVLGDEFTIYDYRVTKPIQKGVVGKAASAISTTVTSTASGILSAAKRRASSLSQKAIKMRENMNAQSQKKNDLRVEWACS